MISTPLDLAFFDAYMATIEQAPEDVIPKLIKLTNASVVPSKPLFGYDYSIDLMTGDQLLAKVMHGANHTGVHVRVQGFYTRTLVPLLRANFPEHSVSRLDGALDLCEEGIFDKVVSKAIELAHAKNMTLSQVGDWTRPDGKGRTLYLGSRESQVMLRIYEKGKQKGLDPNLIRIEAEVKPSKAQAKAKASTMTAKDCLSASKFSRELFKALSGLSLPVYDLSQQRPETTLERSLFFLVKQYGNTLQAANDLLGTEGTLKLLLQLADESNKGASKEAVKDLIASTLASLAPSPQLDLFPELLKPCPLFEHFPEPELQLQPELL